MRGLCELDERISPHANRVGAATDVGDLTSGCERSLKKQKNKKALINGSLWPISTQSNGSGLMHFPNVVI